MAQIQWTKESLEGPKKVPPGVYSIRCDGFEPAKAKKGDSVNLNPLYKVINNPDMHDRRIFENFNSQAGWIGVEICHCFGLNIDLEHPQLPGAFTPENEPDPTKWKYNGPLLG